MYHLFLGLACYPAGQLFWCVQQAMSVVWQYSVTSPHGWPKASFWEINLYLVAWRALEREWGMIELGRGSHCYTNISIFVSSTEAWKPMNTKAWRPRSPKAQEPKSPKSQKPDRLEIQKPKNPKAKKPKSPKVQKPRRPKVLSQKLKRPEVQKSECPKAWKLKSLDDVQRPRGQKSQKDLK